MMIPSWENEGAAASFKLPHHLTDQHACSRTLTAQSYLLKQINSIKSVCSKHSVSNTMESFLSSFRHRLTLEQKNV